MYYFKNVIGKSIVKYTLFNHFQNVVVVRALNTIKLLENFNFILRKKFLEYIITIKF